MRRPVRCNWLIGLCAPTSKCCPHSRHGPVQSGGADKSVAPGSFAVSTMRSRNHFSSFWGFCRVPISRDKPQDKRRTFRARSHGIVDVRQRPDSEDEEKTTQQLCERSYHLPYPEEGSAALQPKCRSHSAVVNLNLQIGSLCGSPWAASERTTSSTSVERRERPAVSVRRVKFKLLRTNDRRFRSRQSCHSVSPPCATVALST